MKRTLSASYLSMLCMELSLVLKAGITLADGFSMLSADEQDKTHKTALAKVRQSMDDGKPAHEAMIAAQSFPKYMTDMVRIGEKTGHLEGVFKGLSEYYDRTDQIAKSVRGAISYPAVLLFLMGFVIIILITQVLPIFNDVYVQLGGKMSGSAAALMNFGQHLSNHWIAIVIVFLALSLGIYVAVKIPPIRKNLKLWMGSLAFSAPLSRAVSRARFASAMAMTMAAGLEIDESIAMAQSVVTRKEPLRQIEKSRELISKGTPFGEAIRSSGIFSALHSQMLIIGLRAGSSDQVMAEIARRCEQEVSDKTQSLLSRIEPTLVIIMSLVVGLILVSVMLPLMTIMAVI